MARFRVQALAPGKRCVGRNPDGSKRFVTFTPDYCRQQAEANNRMLAAGVPVPVCWGHRDDAKPGRLSRDDWESERAKKTAGWVERYAVDSSGVVTAEIEVPDAGDAKQAEAVRFVSPEIDDCTDGDGRDWGEVFTHIALTPRPVQHDQPPLTRLSLTGRIRLSIDPREGTDMADEKKDDSKPKAEKDGDSGGELKALIAALKEAHGLTIPDEVDDIPKLIIAVKAAGSAPADDEMMDDDAGVEEAPGGGGMGGAMGGPMALSLDKGKENVLTRERKDLERRLAGLLRSGRCTPQEHAKRLAELKVVRLSLADDWSVAPTKLATWIEICETLPKGAAFPMRAKDNAARLSLDGRTEEAKPPAADEDDMRKLAAAHAARHSRSQK